MTIITANMNNEDAHTGEKGTGKEVKMEATTTAAAATMNDQVYEGRGGGRRVTFESEGSGRRAGNLSVQDLSKLNIDELHPLTWEVISRQATINIGTIGHVAHGKSTLVRMISSKKTEAFQLELVKNRTIKLGKNAPFRYSCCSSWKSRE